MVERRQRQAGGLSVDDDSTFLDNAQYVLADDVRVIGGEATAEFRDCCAVGTAGRWCCSGTLIAADVVLTAAHCVHEECCRRVFFGDDVRDATRGRVVQVRAAVAHHAYPGTAPFDDIAVLMLSERVDGIPPRAVATAAITSSVATCIVGYGATDAAGESGFGERRKADVPLASLDPRFGIRPETEFVAGRPRLERDSCPGDSGGPAYVEERGQWLLAGVTARSTTPSSPFRVCGDGGVYTKVAAYRDWIARVTG